MYTKFLLSCLPMFATACTAANPRPDAHPVPETLAPGAQATLSMVLPARGVQIYECRARKDASGGYEWSFVAPDARLFDARGNVVGHHGAGPYWEAADGSRVVATVKARADAPVAGAIPWLLLDSRSTGPAGAFSNVTRIQRVNTAGGTTPALPCNGEKAGTRADVDYVADYRFFVGDNPAASSSAWARDFTEVRALGGRNSEQRTPEQSEIARLVTGSR